MPIRVGPVGLSPTLSVTNVGIDTNIFNDSNDPQSDFTTTITPKLQARLRSGRLLFSGLVATGFVYYQKFDDERSIDYESEGRIDADLDWFKPYARASLLDTRERLNAELDARAPRTQTSLAAGARFLTSPKTALIVDVRHTAVEFAQDAEFDGVLLSQTLDSDTGTIEAGLEIYLTPLTTLSIVGSRQQDRFDHSPDRDSDTFRIMPTIRMEAPAIIQGSLAVGYRRFEPLSPELPDYSGVVAQGTLTHTFAERTKLDFTVARDVQYSFEVNEPYYLTTGFRFTLTHQLSDPLDVRASAGRDRLEYREEVASIAPGAPDTPTRTDRADVISGGFGYRIRPTMRFGVDVEYARRLSDVVDRRYDRTRVFASLTYGI